MADTVVIKLKGANSYATKDFLLKKGEEVAVPANMEQYYESTGLFTISKVVVKTADTTEKTTIKSK